MLLRHFFVPLSHYCVYLAESLFQSTWNFVLLLTSCQKKGSSVEKDVLLKRKAGQIAGEKGQIEAWEEWRGKEKVFIYNLLQRWWAHRTAAPPGECRNRSEKRIVERIRVKSDVVTHSHDSGLQAQRGTKTTKMTSMLTPQFASAARNCHECANTAVLC